MVVQIGISESLPVLCCTFSKNQLVWDKCMKNMVWNGAKSSMMVCSQHVREQWGCLWSCSYHLYLPRLLTGRL